MIKDNDGLLYFDELSNGQMLPDEPDVRGWNVKDNAGRTIGKVDNFLVHKERGHAVYLDVEVNEEIIAENRDPYRPPAVEIDQLENKADETHLVIPIGMVEIDRDKKFVFTDQLDYGTFAETKRIRKGDPLLREYEELVLNSYDRREAPQETESIGSKKGFENRSDRSYIDNFYDRKEFDRSPPFRFKL